MSIVQLDREQQRELLEMLDEILVELGSARKDLAEAVRHLHEAAEAAGVRKEEPCRS